MTKWVWEKECKIPLRAMRLGQNGILEKKNSCQTKFPNMWKNPTNLSLSQTSSPRKFTWGQITTCEPKESASVCWLSYILIIGSKLFVPLFGVAEKWLENSMCSFLTDSLNPTHIQWRCICSSPRVNYSSYQLSLSLSEPVAEYNKAIIFRKMLAFAFLFVSLLCMF